jgi:hypothetical protein
MICTKCKEEKEDMVLLTGASSASKITERRTMFVHIDEVNMLKTKSLFFTQ